MALGRRQAAAGLLALLGLSAMPASIARADAISRPGAEDVLGEGAEVLEADLPAARIGALVPDAIAPYFDLILYVNKAAQGPLAQQMFIYERVEGGGLALRHRWLVSTGREKREGYFTTTPAGVFKLDPHRFKERHFSSRWNGVAMPWAMFLDFRYREEWSGLAVHAANRQTVERLGRRDSGGCIRLAPDHARHLFELLLGAYRGKVPAFAFDESVGHTNQAGLPERAEDGSIVLVDGIRALLLVDDPAPPA